MTDPAGGAPMPPQTPSPGAPGPDAAPPPAAAPAPPPAGGSWGSAPPPAQPGGPAPTFQAPQQFQPIAAEAGPAPGVVYADLVTRIIAFVIDAIVLSIAMTIVGVVLVAILFGALLSGGIFLALIAGLVLAAASLAISGIYFVWGWTNPTMRASLGQKVLGLQTVNAADGATLTRDQAIRRWLFLYGVTAIASVLQTSLGVSDIGFLSPIISLLALVYVIYLLWTTSQSAKRQGFHDVQASTVVVKRVA